MDRVVLQAAGRSPMPRLLVPTGGYISVRFAAVSNLWEITVFGARPLAGGAEDLDRRVPMEEVIVEMQGPDGGGRPTVALAEPGDGLLSIESAGRRRTAGRDWYRVIVEGPYTDKT